MKPKKQEEQVVEKIETAVTVQEPADLAKPENDTRFANAAAKYLVDIIKQNNWSKRLGGQSEHIQYEGWQTAGKFYGYMVKTFDAEYVELGGVWGFKAKATVVNEHTGIEVGSAEAYCMSDEYNWKNKPKFQLASMAQTRAGAKALRQNLGFVVGLAGFNPTPVEEMDGVYDTRKPVNTSPSPVKPTVTETILPISTDQKGELISLLGKLKKTQQDLNKLVKTQYGYDSYQELTVVQANAVIKFLEKQIAKKEDTGAVGNFVSPDNVPGVNQLDLDEIDEGIQKQQLGR